MRLFHIRNGSMLTTSGVLVGVSAAVALTFSMQTRAQSIPEEEITYNSHVAAIINENCVVCHRAGGIAPMTFTSYEAVRPWAPIIGYRVGRREMPPYAYDQGIGIQHLIGDWRLEQQDIDTVLAWVEQGAPLGNTDIIPPAVDIPSLDEWNFTDTLGSPDIVISSQPIDIPAVGNDMWHRPYTMTGLNTGRRPKAPKPTSVAGQTCIKESMWCHDRQRSAKSSLINNSQ